MDVKAEIKSNIVKSGYTMTEIVKIWNDRHPDETTTTQNISNKLARGTIKYSEAREIADIIGYEIDWKQKE